MIFDFFSLGLFWYYFNILAATGIVYLMLLIMYQRSKRIIINTAEQPYRPDNTMIKLVFKIGIFAILWFIAREYGFADYVSQFFNWTSEIISEVWNG